MFDHFQRSIRKKVADLLTMIWIHQISEMVKKKKHLTRSLINFMFE